MKIKRLYILLTIFTSFVLLGGLGLIYIDGQKRINLDRGASGKDLKNNLLIINFITKFKTFNDSVYQELGELESGFLQIQDSFKTFQQRDNIYKEVWTSEFIPFLQTKYKLNKDFIRYDQNIIKLKSTLKKKWKQFEDTLNNLITLRMKNGEKFLPGLNRKLGHWGKDIPFLNKVKQSINLSYVDHDHLKELNSLIHFSQWLVKWKKNLKNRSDTFEMLKKAILIKTAELQLDLKIKEALLSELYFLHKNELKLGESIFLHNKQLALLKNSIDKGKLLLVSNIIPSWSLNIEKNSQKAFTSQMKYHQNIFQIVIVLSFLFLFVLLFLFLKIFPLLTILEKKAIKVGKGDFTSTNEERIPNNEFGNVIRAFNQMAFELTEQLKKIKEHEQENIRLTESIQRARRLSSLGEFSAKMAHELKNPISILNFCLADAQEALSKDDVQKCKDEISKSVKVLQRMKVLTVKLGIENFSSDKSRLDINSALNELINLYTALLAKKEINIKFLDNGLSPIVLVSKLELMGAVSNLIDNGIDFLSENASFAKEILIETIINDRFLVIEVSNYGVELDNSKNIFDSMYSSKDGPIRGLGLSIVKDFAKDAGGEIFYRYHENKNVFSIKLPIIS